MSKPLNRQDETNQERLSGTVDRVVFFNPENGYTVLNLRVPGTKATVPVVGTTGPLREGDPIEVVGDWHRDPRFGLQFKSQQILQVHPTSEKGILNYLSSGRIKGIGPRWAKKLVAKFGKKVFEVLEENPEKFLEIPGMGEKKLQRILDSWQEQRAMQDIMVFLQTHNIGPTRAYQIYKKYRNQAITRITENPYRLCMDFTGIGFKIADSVAASLGISSDSPMRAHAGVIHVLQDMATNGHCAATKAALHTKAQDLLNIPDAVVEEALRRCVEEKLLVRESFRGEDLIALNFLHRAEKGIAQHVARLTLGLAPAWGYLPIDAVLDKAEAQTGLELGTSQREAVKMAFSNKVCIITGGPGTGKTTILKTILAGLKEKPEIRVALCAPTGRAAKRMQETTGMEAKTIHRTLEYGPGGSFQRNTENPLDVDLVVVDEGSMPDVSLTYHLFKAIPDHASVIMLGDIDQLPSVGPGSVLKDMIASGVVPTKRLTDIYRQAQDSQIVVNAHRINQGLPPVMIRTETPNDFYIFSDDTPEAIQESVLNLVSSQIPRRFGFDPIEDIQVLVPMHKGPLGTRELNIELQKRLNPPQGPCIKRFGMTYAKGDKILQTVNNYEKEVFNGDIGRIVEIDEEEGLVRVSFDGRLVEYELPELEEISLAYATTIHKSQGSEYPAVVMPLSTQHYVMLERNLLYTGITRGKQLVVLNAQPKALTRAIQTVRAKERKTTLAGRLQDACPFATCEEDDNCGPSF